MLSHPPGPGRGPGWMLAFNAVELVPEKRNRFYEHAEKRATTTTTGPEEKFISTPFMRNSEILRRDRARSAFPGESKWVFSFPGGVPGRNWSIGLYGGNNYSGLNGQFPTHSSISLALGGLKMNFPAFPTSSSYLHPLVIWEAKRRTRSPLWCHLRWLRSRFMCYYYSVRMASCTHTQKCSLSILPCCEGLCSAT